MKLSPFAFASIVFALALNPLELIAKAKWKYSETEGFAIYSNTSKRETQKAVDKLRSCQAVLQTILPELRHEQRVRLQLVVCRGDRTMKEFAPLYRNKPKNLAGFFLQGFEGPLIAIRTDYEDELTQQIIYHEYIHYLITVSGLRLPTWLDEGLAELFSTPERRADGSVVVGSSIPWHLGRVHNHRLLSMERLFLVDSNSPEYNSEKHGQGMLYAQSWIFLHYMLFGEQDLPAEAGRKIIERAVEGSPLDEAFFKETTGIDFSEMEKRLKRFSSKGKYTARAFEVEQASEEPVIALRPMGPGETDFLYGMLTLATRTPKDAYPYLARAAEKLPNDPRVAAYLGYHAWRQDQMDFALEQLRQALALGSQSPYALLNYAEQILIRENGSSTWSQNALDQEETVEILAHLFRARAIAGSFDQRLYEAIARTWLSSEDKPQEKHLAVLSEGLRLYPRNQRLALLLAANLVRIENFNKARKIVNYCRSQPMPPNLKAVLQGIESKLDQSE